MNVLLVSPLPPPYGGIAHWTLLVTLHADSTEGAPNITVLNTAPTRRAALQVSTLARVGEGVIRIFTDNAGLVRELIRQRPDVVHLNTSGHLAFFRDLTMALILSTARVPFVYHLGFGRIPEVRGQDNWEWRAASPTLRRASVVLVLDPRTEQALIESGICRSVQRIPNPIPDESVSRGDIPRRPVALFVGWVIPTKGISELLEAWTAVGDGDWTLEIAGPVDREYFAALQGRGVPSKVLFLGQLDHREVLEKMRNSRIFVFPSYTEGFPNAVLEAMASGLAVIASDVGAINDMVSPDAGTVVKPRNSGMLAKALGDLMVDGDRVRDMGAEAILRVKERYVLSVVFQSYVSLWESVAKPTSRSHSRSASARVARWLGVRDCAD